MNLNVDGPVEVTSSRRRGTVDDSVDLDYFNYHRLDEDIICRIRSLLLSRNDHRPPRTPCPSDESNHRHFHDETPGSFNFSTEKSVAIFASQETGPLGTLDTSSLATKSAEMDARRSRPSLSPHLRKSSSANDVKVPNDTIVQSPSTPTADASHDFPGEPKSRFRLPRLVLQDKGTASRKVRSVRSCIEINPPIPDNDVNIHKTELTCCPPCDPRGAPISKYVTKHVKQPRRAVRAKPGDLACFLSGCSVNPAECKQHHPRRDSVPVRNSVYNGRTGEDYGGVAEGLAADFSRLRNSLKDVKMFSHIVPSAKDHPDSRRPGTRYVQSRRNSSHKRSHSATDSSARREFGGDGQRSMSATPAIKVKPPTSPGESEVCSSATSTADAFPHVLQSLELVAKDGIPTGPRLSTTINTNFNLPGYKMKRASAKRYSDNGRRPDDIPGGLDQQILGPMLARVETVDVSPKATTPMPVNSSPCAVREKQSESSLKSNPASILSGGSRSSARHALLKPSITQAQPVDRGLPITPVLSPIAGFSAQVVPETRPPRETMKASIKEDTRPYTIPEENPTGVTEVRVSIVSPFVGNLLNFQVAEDLLKSVQSRLEETQPSQHPGTEDVPQRVGSQVGEAQGRQQPDEVEETQPAKQLLSEPTDSGSPPLTLIKPKTVVEAQPSQQHLPEAAPPESPPLTLIRPKTIVEAQPSEQASSEPAHLQSPPLILIRPKTVVEANEQPPSEPAYLQSPAPTLIKSKAVSEAQITTGIPQPMMIEVDPASATQALQAIGSMIDYPEKRTADSAQSMNAAYWGFLPAVKEAVQDAVQVAVRNAVQEAVVPLGVEKDVASDAYRKLVANSLAEAAKNADEYLRRASIWNGRPSFPQADLVSESTVIHLGTKENVFSGDEMESVPLNTDERKPSKTMRPRGFSRKKGGAYAYDAIPTRKSSKMFALSPKTTSTNASMANEKGPRKRSFERLKSRPTLRSISSEASLKQDGDKPLREVKEEPRVESSSLSGFPSEEAVGRKDTVRWLKGLLSNSPSSNSTYEPKFTALPPRTRRDSTIKGRPTRSQTAPVKPVEDLFLDARERPVFVKDQLSPVKRNERAGPSETFARTINDLENLMNEAMIIARQAADNQEAEYVPAVLGDATKVLKSARDGFRSRLTKTRYSEEVPSVHESLMGVSDSDISDDSYDELVDEEPRITYPESVNFAVKHSAAWPPTGRVTTPYPPGSMPPSNGSRSTGVEKLLIGADPRSLPTEMDLEPPTLKYLNEDDESFDGQEPEFYNPEPFIAPVTRSGTRKMSERSPKGTSPTRLTQSGPAPDPRTYQDIGPLPKITPRNTARVCIKEHSEEDHASVESKLALKSVPNKQEVHDYIVANRNPPIQPRTSSRNLRKQAEEAQRNPPYPATIRTSKTGQTYDWQNIDAENVPLVLQDIEAPQQQEEKTQTSLVYSFDGNTTQSEEVDFDTGFGVRHRGGGEPSGNGQAVQLEDKPDPNLPQTSRSKVKKAFSLRGKNHVSLNEHHNKGFSLAKSAKRQKIARDWSPGRKRFVASVACLSTALIGILVGIYAGETPAIQYYIVDFHHYTVLGNVFFFIGLAIPTLFFWPLPLLHGRKPYILGAMSMAMPLLFPQALAVGSFRSPYVSVYRVGLILSRALMGFCLGFANMNFKSMLMDLFGASLCADNPHQEHVDEFDVRRHGGGMGVWLGLWTWSALGSIGLGFLIGAVVVNHLPPAWGFYVSTAIIAFVMLLNVLCPEVRRSAFRRSVAEHVDGDDVSRRLGRGEVKMHMVKSGPKWWGEEFHYGVMLSMKMLRQPGFMVMAVYVAWIYGQMVLNILLLGALMSKDYKFKSPAVGASVMAIPLGALAAILFTKASLFSRAHNTGPTNDDQTYQKKTSWSSHMVRRTIFILVLPFAGLGYTLSASGPPIPFMLPIFFAGLIGFLSNLAMAECHGIIMETFDTSDLQPGMTGRPRGSSGEKTASKRTNYSSFPRVCSAFGITQGLGYLVAAAASGVGGILTRHLGQQAACGVMAGILLILSILLLCVLVRFTEVQIIPDSKKNEMDRYHNARRASQLRRDSGLEEDEPWRPVIIGNPHHHTRRMCLLELGSMSRFSEIRRKNKLVDENSLESKHPNRAALGSFEKRIKQKEIEIFHHVRRSVSRNSSRRSDKLNNIPEQGDLGGHREMGSRGVSGNGLGQGRASKVMDIGRVPDAG